MFSQLAVLALAAIASATPMPQGVTDAISPQHPVPAGCSINHFGTFQITTVNASSSQHKRSLEVRAEILTLSLAGGQLKDQTGRTGYIASNFQFQFDAPPQAGAIYTSGFSLCGNKSLALGGSAIWYQCLSGGFYNLYDRHWAAQCSPIYIMSMGGSSAPAASQASYRQPSITTAVTQLTDSQPQATPVTQLTDGQPQGHSAGVAPITQLTDGQPQATTAATGTKSTTTPIAKPVTQITDGQIQATGATNNVSGTSVPKPFAGGAGVVHLPHIVVAVMALAGAMLVSV